MRRIRPNYLWCTISFLLFELSSSFVEYGPSLRTAVGTASRADSRRSDRPSFVTPAYLSLYSSPSSTDASGDYVRQRNRHVDETTWMLLNTTTAMIGEWDRSHFATAETIVQVWTQRQSKRAALVVERLLRRIVQEQMAGNPYADGVDMTALYTNLIEGWAKSREAGGAERAEEVLDYFQRIYEEEDSYDPLLCGPGLGSFNAVIGAYARSNRDDAPEQAIRVLAKLYDLNHDGRTVVLPNKETYAQVLRAYANKGSEDSPERVRKLLEHMKKLAVSYPSVKPDYTCHNEYMCALSEAVNQKTIGRAKGATLAEEYLKMMLDDPDEKVRPDTWTFNFLLAVLGRSGLRDSTERAEAVMAKLEAYDSEMECSDKTRPNVYSYNSLMVCYTKHGSPGKALKAYELLQKMKRLGETNASARPDVVSYNICMNAFSKSGQRDAPTKVEALLREMNDLYNRTGDVRIRPNRRSINTCLDAWAKSRLVRSDETIMAWINMMWRAQEDGQIKIGPDQASYNSYLQALSKSSRSTMGIEAEKVLADMEKAYQSGYQSVKPNVMTFTNVIHCFAMSGQDNAVERALAILERMEDLHAQGFGDVRPNLFTYNCVINTIAKSSKPGKAKLALNLLRRVQSVALKPGCVSFNNVINACAFSKHKEDDPEAVLKIALEVLKETQAGPGANWITYQTTIRVICSFEKDTEKKWQLTKDIFRQCCEDGQLTRAVLTQARFAVSEGQFAMLEHEVIDPNTKRLKNKYTANAQRSFRDGETSKFHR